MRVVGINDTGAKCSGKAFSQCVIHFRGKVPENAIGKLRLSKLININLVNCKQQVICYCDGMIESPVPAAIQKIVENIIEEPKQEIKLDPVKLEDFLADIPLAERDEEQENIEKLYNRDKINWVNRHGQDQELIEAIRMGYPADMRYLKERIDKEIPGAYIVDHTTFLYQAQSPSMEAMKLEKEIAKRIASDKVKYGTYTRICLLESHQRESHNFAEILAIFNYLYKFDIFLFVR